MLPGNMERNLFCRYALRSVGGDIENLPAPPKDWVAPNSFLYKNDNRENSDDDHLPSDDSDDDSEIVISSDNEELEESDNDSG